MTTQFRRSHSRELRMKRSCCSVSEAWIRMPKYEKDVDWKWEVKGEDAMDR